jgi:hypothetical protein
MYGCRGEGRDWRRMMRRRRRRRMMMRRSKGANAMLARCE